MTTKTAKTIKPKPLTLHRFIIEMSFWGVFTRWLFVTIFAILAVGLWAVFDNQMNFFWPNLLVVIVVSLMFAFYDGLYVNMSRTVPLKPVLDKTILFASELLFIALAIISTVVAVPEFVIKIVAMTPIFATLILLIRLVLGVMWSKKSR